MFVPLLLGCFGYGAFCRNAGQLQNANNRLERYANSQDSFQRKQHHTNDKLLRGIGDLTHLVQTAVSSPAGAAVPAAAAMDGSSSGALGAQAAGPLSAVRRLTANTTKVLAGSRAVRTKSNASASSTDNAVSLARAMSDLSSPASPTAAAEAAAGCAEGQGSGAVGDDGVCPEASDSSLVLSLKEQLDQQHKALQLQQELLQQVLARLPPAL